MLTRAPSPIHTAGPRPQPKPRIYNRPWHLDADGRRHRGRRKWEPMAVEAIIELAAGIDWLYPPDFSRRDFIRFRASGGEKPLADLRTGRPDCLRLILYPGGQNRMAMLPKRGIVVSKTAKGIEVRFVSRHQISTAAFARCFRSYANRYRPHPGKKRLPAGTGTMWPDR
jgi:hypothetical protein